MSEDPARRAIIDTEHLNLLYYGYIVSSAISAFFGMFGLFYLAMGAMMATMFSQIPANRTDPNGPPPAFVGWIFAGIGLTFLIIFIALAALKFRAAFCIKNRKSHTFCIVIAALSCLGIPYGTLLGVLSIIVLTRESVKAQFT